MWLLRLHIAVSILCLLTCDGFCILCKQGIEENGWKTEKKSLFKRIINHWIYFIPLMNFIAVIATFMMISVKKTKYEEFAKKQEGKKDET